MSKARTLADFISDGSEFADGTISVAEVSGAAPLASPSFTGNLTVDTDTLYVDSANERIGINKSIPDYALHVVSAQNVPFQAQGDHSGISYVRIRNSATAANGVGAGIELRANSSVQDRQVGFITADWTDSTDASRASEMKFYIAAFGGQSKPLVMQEDAVTINQDGLNSDFRVESDTNTHALFVDASANEVGINQSNPLASLHVNDGVTMSGGWIRSQYLEAAFPVIVFNSTYATDSWGGIGYDSTNQNLDFWVGATSENVSADNSKKVLRIRGTDGFVWNDTGESQLDFRLESDNYSHMLFVDASYDHVSIGRTGGANNYNGLFQVGSNISGTVFTSTTAVISNPTTMGSAAGSAYRILQLAQNTGNSTALSFSGIRESTGSTFETAAFEVTLDVDNTNNVRRFQKWSYPNGNVFNDSGNNSIDFRVESDAQSHMLFVDANENHIAIKHDNPNAELDVKGEQVLRGNTNGGGITQMADSGVYTASTSATNIFQIYGLSNQSAEITIIYTDGSYRNGSFLQKIYVSCHGSGTAPAGPNVIVENKSRAHNGTFPSHFTWTTSTSGSYVIFAATANTTVAGGGTIHVHVNSISSTGGKSLEMLI